MKEFVEGYRTDRWLTEQSHSGHGSATLGGSNCPPLNGVAFFMSDSPDAILALRAFGVGVKAAFSKTSPTKRFEFLLTLVNTTLDGAAAALASELKVKLLDIVGAVVTKEMLDVEDVAFINLCTSAAY
ncbi:hypothetical protein TcBrA4_0102910 [Trypanosoma cruzi]|nr:hypothetical protein TcBrA4_0102910 [Trypanosoma cruzi]